MTMYLPNPAVHPAESDPVEFLEVPSMASEAGTEVGTSVEGGDGTTARLRPQATADITRWPRDDVTELVAEPQRRP